MLCKLSHLTRLVAIFAGVVSFHSNAPALAADPVCSAKTFERTDFIVCTADPARHDIRLYLKNADGQNYARPDAVPREGLLFSINAGMFTPSYAPAGLYVENSNQSVALNTRTGPGNFHLMPNGVFWMKDGRARVSTTQDFAKLSVKPDLATQSGPMLVINGKLHPKFDENGPSRTIRNGVGVTAAGHVFFAISEEPVSFGVFARLFRDALACPNALYLDGAVSQLYIPGENRFVGGVTLGPLFAVYSRSP